MNLFTLQSIRRRTYFLGLIVINVISYSFIFLIRGNLVDQNIITTSIIFSLFFGLVKIIWDYKRIIDISTNRLYLLLLIFPIISEAITLFTKSGSYNSFISSFSNLDSKSFSLFIMFGIFLLLSVCYKLFLFFKKGNTSVNIQPTPEVKI